MKRQRHRWGHTLPGTGRAHDKLESTICPRNAGHAGCSSPSGCETKVATGQSRPARRFEPLRCGNSVGAQCRKRPTIRRGASDRPRRRPRDLRLGSRPGEVGKRDLRAIEQIVAGLKVDAAGAQVGPLRPGDGRVVGPVGGGKVKTEILVVAHRKAVA